MWLSLTNEHYYVSCDLHLCLCYNVPSGSSREAMMEEKLFDRLTDRMVHFKAVFGENCRIIICGDLNARVSDLKDYVTDNYARHIFALPDDYITDMEMPRKTEDNGTNENRFMQGNALQTVASVMTHRWGSAHMWKKMVQVQLIMS